MGTSNLLQIPNIKAGTKVHPTQKPVELMKILIENSSNENDVVMDCFMRKRFYWCCLPKSRKKIYRL